MPSLTNKMLLQLTRVHRISIDTIERAKTPTREDALAARLKSLRSHDEASPSSTRQSQSPTADRPSQRTAPSESKSPSVPTQPSVEVKHDDEADDALFRTDDETLEELLADLEADEQFEPDDEQVKAFLEELSRAIPQDEASRDRTTDEDEKRADSDDSDGEDMTREADDVVARFRDEAEVDAALRKNDHHDGQSDSDEDEDEDGDQPESNTPPDSDLALPSVPSTLQDLPSTPPGSTNIDSITARLAALRTSPSPSPSPLDLPSVPTSKPAKAVKRLTSKTDYTDDDMDGWCTVCLEDATLKCLGCDDDPYCARCWREMHVGPAAGFDERGHRAVQFTKDKKAKEKKVALGA